MVLDKDVKAKVARNVKVHQTWELLAVELGFDEHDPTVYRIKNQRRPGEMELKVRDLLCEWEVQKPQQATLANLIDALKNTDNNQLADSLQNMQLPVYATDKKNEANGVSPGPFPTDEVVKDGQLSRLANKLGEPGWRRFALEQLDIDSHELDKYPVGIGSIHTASMAMLKIWKNREGRNATVYRLKELVNNARHDGYVDITNIF